MSVINQVIVMYVPGDEGSSICLSITMYRGAGAVLLILIGPFMLILKATVVPVECASHSFALFNPLWTTEAQLEVSSKVSKKTRPLSYNFFRINGLCEVRLQAPPTSAV